MQKLERKLKIKFGVYSSLDKVYKMRRSEVIKYINDIKDPKKFIEYCKKFHEKEQRDIAYVVSRNVISKDPSNINFILAGAKLIIITWNAIRFQRLPKGVRDNLENDILEAYMKTKLDLEKLRGERLENLNLNDDELKKTIMKIFLEFSSKKSIEFTGASKILHVLNPYVFMMWDSSIRNAYHKLHANNHNPASPDCYLEFLKQSQEIIKSVLSKRSEDDIWNDHLTFIDKDFMAAFSFKESTLKMLDECNYVRFKLNIKL
jgi:hypothetical protein